MGNGLYAAIPRPSRPHPERGGSTPKRSFGALSHDDESYPFRTFGGETDKE